MLARQNRLTSGADIRHVIRSGKRSSNKFTTIHYLLADTPSFAIVTSRAVGNAVVRNQLRRRTKALLRNRLDLLTPVTAVIRYRAGAGDLSFDQLSETLDELMKGFTH